MLRRAIVLISLAALYIAYQRRQAKRTVAGADHEADAQWANEGGANAPASV